MHPADTAELRLAAKLAAWARYGFKLAGLKRADIDKRITGEVLVAGGPTAGDAIARLAGPMAQVGGEQTSKAASLTTPDGMRPRTWDELPLSSKILILGGSATMLAGSGVLAADAWGSGPMSTAASLAGAGLLAGGAGMNLAGRYGQHVPLDATKTAGLINEVAPSFGAALDAFEAERRRQDFLQAQKDAVRFPASHYTQPMMQQYAMGGDIASAPAPSGGHHHRRHHHH